MPNGDVKLKFLHICEQTIISSDDKVSIINIFSGISTKGFPVIHPKFCVVANVKGPVGRYKESIEIISPDEKSIIKVEGEIEIKGEGGNNFVGNFINTLFNTEGKYWIKVVVDSAFLTSKDEHFILVKKSI